MFQGGGFGMTSCVTPANLLELWCRHSARVGRLRQLVQKFSNTVDQLKKMGLSPDTPSPWLPRNLPAHRSCCFAVWGPPRENPGPRPNNRCLTLCATVRFSVLCLHHVSWSLRFGVHRVKTLGTVPITVFSTCLDWCFCHARQSTPHRALHTLVRATVRFAWLRCLLGPGLLRKHQGAASRCGVVLG